MGRLDRIRRDIELALAFNQCEGLVAERTPWGFAFFVGMVVLVVNLIACLP